MDEEDVGAAARPSAEESKPADAVLDISDLSTSSPNHPLHTALRLWALLGNQSPKEDWHGPQMLIGEFDTVEDFWRHFNNIKMASKLATSDLSMFKKAIAPACGDEMCKHGCQWVATLDNKTSFGVVGHYLDEAWLAIVLNMVNENFVDVGGEIVCAAVVSAGEKGRCQVAVWLSEREEEKFKRIG